jgi:hypothetical protein
MSAAFFASIPVAVPTGLSDDEKLLAAWSGRPNPKVEGVPTVRWARRRLIALRGQREVA